MQGIMVNRTEIEVRQREIDTLIDVPNQIVGNIICTLGDAAAWPVQGLIRHYRHVIEQQVDQYAANPDQHGAVHRIAAE